MLSLVDTCHVLGYCDFSQCVKSLEDAFIGEVEVTVAMATVLLDRLLEGTLLCNMSLFVAVVAEVVAASASKERTLYWTTITWGQGHPVFSCRMHQGVGHMSISYLLQGLYLFHLPLHSIHLHVDSEQGA